ncbi:flagellar motor switch protein [Ligilactobacillus salitolerans]|uniref:Flagellar motor switch protein FliM n=1 Tax=Ligilactobacillus salitolerans TaxID=1808352 RepID=A0A401ITQ5_9LACO|nr:flagellar motor switch protein FliM [Ligilactobacillus salitolerans]GBG94904.1 flagellar motor switch protein [Ligilactobacillus salitolerans]
MDQVLSQQEIDSLLSAYDSGELDEEVIENEQKEETQAKPYDFRRPTRLSKEYINTLHMIFEDFAKMSGNVLSNILRTNFDMQLASIEQISYDEFIHSIPRVTMVGMFNASPLKGSQMIEINPQLCMTFIELLCGGFDQENNRKQQPSLDKNGFTEIEMSLLEGVMEEFSKILQSVWKEVVSLDVKLDGLETNPQLMQTLSPNEPVVLATFTVQIFGVSTFINLCIPYVSFEGILDKLSLHNWFDTSQQLTAADQSELKRGLNKIELPISVLLGSTEMDLADFLKLEPGDVIKLDSKITQPLDAFVEERPFYQVKPGKQNGQLAVELLSKIEGEEEE